jgi:hypothetical protein
MFDLPPKREEVLAFVQSLDQHEIEQCVYLCRLGMTFTQVCLLEDHVANALLFCKRLKLRGYEEIPDDADNLVGRQRHLHEQTFGNLIQIFQANNFPAHDVNYLKFLRKIRDKFIHRFFLEHPWPGDADRYPTAFSVRRLLHYGRVFERGASRIYPMLVKQGHYGVHDLGDAGALYFDPDLFGPLSKSS